MLVSFTTHIHQYKRWFFCNNQPNSNTSFRSVPTKYYAFIKVGMKFALYRVCRGKREKRRLHYLKPLDERFPLIEGG